MLSVVRARGGDAYDLHLADAAALPFPDASFERVLCVNTIYFWPDPARALREIHRVLKPGGRLVLGYGSKAFLRLNPLTWFGFRVYSDGKTRRLLEEAGFAAEIRSPGLVERIAVGTKP
jgi:ubiquinone/menaquinone biosynthesis C-methylase UbiE